MGPLALSLALLFLTALAAQPVAADAPQRLHEARFTYHVDHSAIPEWVTARETTLIVDIGPALDVFALGDGQPVPCAYDGQRALVTTDAQEIVVIVTAPSLPLGEMGDVRVAALRGDKNWALSLTLDDGYESQATTAKDLLDRYDYKASIAVWGEQIGQTHDGDEYATGEQLGAVLADGWYLANHTHSHKYAWELGGEDGIVRDVRQCNEDILAAVPDWAPILFTSPFTDEAYAPVLKAHHEELGLRLIQDKGWEGRDVDPGEIPFDDYVPGTLGRTQLLNDGRQFDAFHEWAQAHPGEHRWLSLHSHNVVPVCDCVETAMDILYRTYGAGGTDEVWMAPAPDVYQYLIVRDRISPTLVSRMMPGDPPEGYTLPEPAPTPALYTATLQQGLNGYEGTRDAYISSFYAADRDRNFGNDGALRIQLSGSQSSLISFDLTGEVPSDAIVERAMLRLWGLYESNHVTKCLSAYPMLRAWDEGGVTWNASAEGHPWDTDGEGKPIIDHAAEHTGLRGVVIPGQTLPVVNHWYEIELTEAVQAWIDDPDSNDGLFLAGSGGGEKYFSMASSEHVNSWAHPTLIISYTRPISDVLLPHDGDGLLLGRVLLEGHGEPPSSLWAVPLTVTLSQTTGGVAIYRESVVTGQYGEFTLSNLRPGSYDLTVRSLHALPVVQRALTITSGLNMVTLGPLVEGEVVPDGHVGARDQGALDAAMGTTLGDAAYSPQADLNDDGSIDSFDAGLLAANYGRYGATLQGAGPEPLGDIASLSISPAQGYVAQGQEIVMDVVLDTGDQAVDGMELWITFDPDYVTLGDLAPTGAFPLTLAAEAAGGQDGLLHYAAANLSEPVSGTCTVLRIPFTGVQRTPHGGMALAFATDRPQKVVAGGYDVLGGSSGATLAVGFKDTYLPNVHSSGPSGMSRSARLAARLAGHPEPIPLTIVGNYPLSDPPIEARDVQTRDGCAYIALSTPDGDTRLICVLDVSVPGAPQLMGTGFGNSYATDELWLEGDHVYVAKKSRGVEILNVSSPTSIPPGNTFRPDSHVIAKALHVVGNRLYIADEFYGLQVVDVTHPASPSLMGSFGEGTVFGEGVWVDGETAYVAADRSGVRFIDVSDPYDPFPLQPYAKQVPWLEHALPGRAVDVQVENGMLYVAAEDAGISVFDVADPHLPGDPETFGTHFAEKIDVVEGIVYVADGEAGLVVIDATDASDMHAVAYCDTPGKAYGVSVRDGHAYVADGEEGLQVIALSGLTPTATATPTQTPTQTPMPTVTCTPTRGPIVIPLVMK